MPAGRPSIYSEKVADKICNKIADGEGLITICAADDMPAKTTVFRWLESKPEFRDKYARAREDQAEVHADEIITIADTEEDVNRAKVRIDARKWTASKLRPKKYGSFQQVEMTGETRTTHSLDENMEQAVSSVCELFKAISAGSRNPKGDAGN